MKLSRLASLVLVLVLCVSTLACAETTVVNQWTLENTSISMNTHNGTLAVQNRKNGVYTLYTPDGTPLTTKPYVYMSNDSSLMKVAVSEGLNNFGYIDATGRELVPTQYGDLICLSDRWQLGVKLTPATADQYDYKSFGGGDYYLVTAYDVYFDGRMVGSLERGAYDYGYAYGAYLYIRNKNGDYIYYNSAMQPSSYKSDYASSSEYEETRNGIFHRGSNQKVGVPGCTLTSDDVELDLFFIDGRCVDLQGNVIFALDAKYEYVNSFKGDYAQTRMNGRYGLIDRTGREVLACEYASLSYGEEYFEGGYQIAVKDGKVGFLNTNGEVTSPFKYAEGSVKSTYRMPFTHLVDLDGSIIVLSAAAGELSQRFMEVRINSTNGAHVFVGEPEEKKAGVYDLYGNVVIPADGRYDDAYDLTVSHDGKTVLGYSTERVYTVYQLSGGAAEEPAVVPAAPVENHQQPAADGSWNCTCGSTNTTKFCPNCGSAKPEEMKCVNCGFKPAAGQSPKFCPECGTKF